MDGAGFFQGVGIGLAISLPVGPIAVLVVRRTLADGWRAGLAAGLGCATTIALFGGVAGFGLTAVSDLLLGQRRWLSLVGGCFLLYLAAGPRVVLA